MNDITKHRLAAPLLVRRLDLLRISQRPRCHSRHVYAHGRGYGELLALADALDRGLDFKYVVARYDTAIYLCGRAPFHQSVVD